MGKSDGFMDNYKKYDVRAEGFGDRSEWKDAFRFRMGLDEAKRAVGADSPLVILGLAAGATWEAIKAAYRKLVMQHHPDRGGDPAAFRKVQGAYEVLEHQFGKA